MPHVFHSSSNLTDLPPQAAASQEKRQEVLSSHSQANPCHSCSASCKHTAEALQLIYTKPYTMYLQLKPIKYKPPRFQDITK